MTLDRSELDSLNLSKHKPQLRREREKKKKKGGKLIDTLCNCLFEKYFNYVTTSDRFQHAQFLGLNLNNDMKRVGTK